MPIEDSPPLSVLPGWRPWPSHSHGCACVNPLSPPRWLGLRQPSRCTPHLGTFPPYCHPYASRQFPVPSPWLIWPLNCGTQPLRGSCQPLPARLSCSRDPPPQPHLDAHSPGPSSGRPVYQGHQLDAHSTRGIIWTPTEPIAATEPTAATEPISAADPLGASDPVAATEPLATPVPLAAAVPGLLQSPWVRQNPFLRLYPLLRQFP